VQIAAPAQDSACQCQKERTRKGDVSMAQTEPTSLPEPLPSRLPLWRGFNLLAKFTLAGSEPFRESDFDLVREWGFNFVRLPLDYRPRPSAGDRWRLEGAARKETDDAVRFGRERGIHVNLTFPRAPGYCVNPPAEPLDLWRDPEAQELAAAHWRQFAERYRGI